MIFQKKKISYSLLFFLAVFLTIVFGVFASTNGRFGLSDDFFLIVIPAEIVVLMVMLAGFLHWYLACNETVKKKAAKLMRGSMGVLIVLWLVFWWAELVHEGLIGGFGV